MSKCFRQVLQLLAVKQIEDCDTTKLIADEDLLSVITRDIFLH